MEEFADNVVRWYERERRNFPWRNIQDPYRVLLTEILLIRTNAHEVEKIWHDFFEKYPDIETLSSASESEIADSIASLGLAWRAETIVALAAQLEQIGEIPNNDSIFELPGVGDYVGNAVLCFAYGQKRPVIDSNVQLVLGELFNPEYTDKEPYSSMVENKVLDLMPEGRVQEFYFGLIDLGEKFRQASYSELQKIKGELLEGCEEW